MENILKLLSSLSNGKSENNNQLSNNLSTLLPLFSSLMDNNKQKGATKVTPELLSIKLNNLIRESQ